MLNIIIMLAYIIIMVIALLFAIFFIKKCNQKCQCPASKITQLFPEALLHI